MKCLNEHCKHNNKKARKNCEYLIAVTGCPHLILEESNTDVKSLVLDAIQKYKDPITILTKHDLKKYVDRTIDLQGITLQSMEKCADTIARLYFEGKENEKEEGTSQEIYGAKEAITMLYKEDLQETLDKLEKLKELAGWKRFMTRRLMKPYSTSLYRINPK
jgi:transcriptional regulator of heat shock response